MNATVTRSDRGILAFLSISLLAMVGVMISTPKAERRREETHFHSLGDKMVPVYTTQIGNDSSHVFISLHDDENTSETAGRKYMEKHGGMLVKLGNEERRNLVFFLNKRKYTVDPNRMFSDRGISRSLSELGRNSPRAREVVSMFAQHVLRLVPENRWWIALHNNTEGKFNVRHYVKGGSREKEAEKVYINPEKDPDDFFLTTEEELFEKLSAKGYNCILQKRSVPDDGSLSVYAAKKGIPYVNLETEHGKEEVYEEMLEVLMGLL